MPAGAFNALGAAPLAAPQPQPQQQQMLPFVSYLQQLASQSQQGLRRAPMQRLPGGGAPAAQVPPMVQPDLPQFQLPGQPAPTLRQELLAYAQQRNPLMAPDQNANPMALMMMQQQPQQEVPYM